ncbi:hypothetical protein PGTUg99_014862 [Puccinia graminis f. sp. tritici]|uniref:Sin1 middle CRIM domain-containing protein n=1 Tax=Puccinia graminis f. sp. tritici TaxID=56615 RepID=A0A5B0QGW8_PUCGR|nr:hypothetical protein PGTUg99_014862 [Puccinia graminis f. sp. tritici]
MSLLVDPQYFLHTLKLNYLRRLPDPIGPSSISFPSNQTIQQEEQEQQQEPEAGPSKTTTTTQTHHHLSNPYIQLSGLADSQRWPELLVRGSPPEPLPVLNQHSNDQTPIRTRRRRADGNQAPNPPSGGTGLRYSETIVGPKGSGLGAGMRVSGRKSIRTSRQPSRLITDLNPITSTPPTQPPQPATSQNNNNQPPLDRAHHQTTQNLDGNPAAGALALTEGRTTVIPGGGLNPEDSDEEPNPASRPSQLSNQDESQDRRPISRNPTNTTIKTHRRRISAITFASNPLSFASPPGSILNLSRSRTRAQRGHSISSIATTNTVISSDFSEHANQTFNSPTPSHLPLNAENLNSRANDTSEITDQPPSPFTQPPLDSESNADVYYSTEHDPDKRMSDMLFTYRPFDARRSTQIVGRVELEPAPLLEADNEDDTGDEDIETDQTDTGTELGEDDSSFNLEEIGEDSGTMDDNLSIKSRRRRPKRDLSSIGTSSIDLMTPADETKDSLNKSLSSGLATSIVESNSLNRTNGQSPDVLISVHGVERGGNGNQSPPMVRRRERRRVNIKMGKLVGPPIIEEDSIGPSVDSDSPPIKVVEPLAPGLRLQRGTSSVARPSLPDLRQAIGNPTANTSTEETPRQQETSQTSGSISSFSPGRARALTTPTPIPGLELNPVVSKIKEDEMNDEKAGGDTSSGSGQRTFPRNRSGSGPIGMSRIRRSLLQTGGQNLSRPQSSNGPITPTPPTNTSSTQVSEQPKPAPAPKRARKPKRAQLSFKKIELEDPKLKKPVVQKSILTQLLTAQSASSSGDNPFRCFYALLASKERNALKISLYYPFSKEPSKPIKSSMKADVCVEEVVGFALWNYVEENREPKLGEIKNCPDGLDLHETFAWCLRLVEDDGEVDEDFPALDRTRPAAKVGSNEFAIVMATEAQAKQNEAAQTQIQRRPSRVLGEPKRVTRAAVEPTGSVNTGAASLLPPPINALMGNSGTIFDGARGVGGGVSGSLLTGGYSSTPLGGSSFTGSTVYLKVRIPSPGKGVDSINTTLNVTMDMYLADVLESLVKKKSLGQVKDWALLVPSSPSIPAHQRDIVVPLDRTVQSLQGVNSLALVKRSQVSSKLLRNTQLNSNISAQNTNPSASIFKRLSEIPQPKYVSITDLTSSSKSFLIQTKRRGILGKSDRLLTIEDDYVHIAPNHQSMIANNHHHHHHLAGNDTSLVSSANGKVSSYHISQIVDCIHRPQAGFKLVVLRDSGEKRYDVEAENAQSAIHVCISVQ